MKILRLAGLVALAVSAILITGCGDDSGAGPIRDTKNPSPGMEGARPGDSAAAPTNPAANGAPPQTQRVTIPGQAQGNGH